VTDTGNDDGSEEAATLGADAEATAALFARCGVSLPVVPCTTSTRHSEGPGRESTRVNDAADSSSQAEQDAAHAWLGASNCLPHEGAGGPELLDVGTSLRPLKIPRSEAWQQSYSMLLLVNCEADHARLLAARERLAARVRDAASTEEPHQAWSRAVDLCDQALRMIEGAGAVNDERIRRILLAVCQYETSKTSLGFIPGVVQSSARTLTEELRAVGATMADVPSAEQLVTWAFPWL
jgi:hypothetical protein